MRAHITVVCVKEGFRFIWQKTCAEMWSRLPETTAAKASQQAVKGVPEEISKTRASTKCQ